MKKRFLSKKIIFVTFCALFVASFAFALPGVTPYIQDVSGEYVFYVDKTFTRESYIGFLFYDEGTYAARYFAPKTQSLPEKNIEFLFTVNTEKPYLEMTGERILTERIVGELQKEDADIVNYIHDLIYEFSSRRRKIGAINPENQKIPSAVISAMKTGVSVNQEYAQFGGDVDILFDYLIPIFNIKSITDNKNNVSFEIVTVGHLESSDDKSFSSFKNEKVVMPKAKKSIVKKNSNPIDFQVLSNTSSKSKFSQSVLIDNAWKKGNTNTCSLENKAFLTIDEMANDENIDSVLLINSLLRNSMQSSTASYVDWKTLKIQYSPIGFVVRSSSTQNANDSTTNQISVVSEMAKNVYGYLNLLVYSSEYEKDSSYFENIVKSYQFFIENK